MAARKTKRSHVALARKRSDAAKRGWETRRAREREKERQHKKRSEAAKRGARRHRAKVRAREALSTFKTAVDSKARSRELQAVKRSWYKAKSELLFAVDDDYEAYLGILDEIADDTDTTWDIAYGPEESAA